MVCTSRSAHRPGNWVCTSGRARTSTISGSSRRLRSVESIRRIAGGVAPVQVLEHEEQARGCAAHSRSSHASPPGGAHGVAHQHGVLPGGAEGLVVVVGERGPDELAQEGSNRHPIPAGGGRPDALQELAALDLEGLAVADARGPADGVGEDAEGRPRAERVGPAGHHLDRLVEQADLLQKLAAQAGLAGAGGADDEHRAGHRLGDAAVEHPLQRGELAGAPQERAFGLPRSRGDALRSMRSTPRKKLDAWRTTSMRGSSMPAETSSSLMAPGRVRASMRTPRSMISPSTTRAETSPRPVATQMETSGRWARNVSAHCAARSARSTALPAPHWVTRSERPGSSVSWPPYTSSAASSCGVAGPRRGIDASASGSPAKTRVTRRCSFRVMEMGAPVGGRGQRERQPGASRGRRRAQIGVVEHGELAQHRRRIREAVGGGLGHHPGDQRVERLGEIGPDLARAGRLLEEDLREHGHHVRALVGGPPREALVEHAPEREHVDARIALAAPLEQLGRDVPGRAQHYARARQPRLVARDVGDAEVEELHLFEVAPHDEDVAGLDVAVDEPALVSEGQRGGGAAHHPQALGDGEALAEHPPGEILALEPLPWRGSARRCARRRAPRTGRCRGGAARRGRRPRARSARRRSPADRAGA